MPFDWNDFLSLAQRLAASTDEASKRTAISRAYYCAFILAFERAESAGCRYPRGEGYHQWCWRKYSRPPTPPVGSSQLKEIACWRSECGQTTRRVKFVGWMIQSSECWETRSSSWRILQLLTRDTLSPETTLPFTGRT